MGILNGLLGNLAKKQDSTGIVNTRDALLVSVQCDKCGEVVNLRLRKSSEIQRDYDGNKDYAFFVNKVVIGNGCFNRMELRIELDSNYRVVRREIKGGKFVPS